MTIRKIFAIGLLLGVLGGSAFGQAIPEPEKIVVERGEVAHATCSLLFHCLVTLPEGETLSGGVVGDGGRWEVGNFRQGRQEVLSVKPKECGVQTSFSVLTDRATYELLLTSEPCEEGDFSPVGRSTRVVFKGRETSAAVLSFSGEPMPPAREIAGGGTAGPEFFLGTRGGYGWEKKRRFPAKPMAILSDDARTYVLLEKGALAPAIFGLDEDGKERIVDFNVYGPWVVVNEVLEGGILRVGAGATSELRFARSR